MLPWWLVMRTYGPDDSIVDGTSLLDAKYRSAGSPHRLDLSGLLSADEAGIELLRTLQAEGAELHGASPYFRQLLEEETP